jgi:integration host factor subunit beta
MTKAELVDRVSGKVTGLTKKHAEVIVNTVFDSIKEALAAQDKVEVRGFGSFHLRFRKERSGRNPKTGGSVFVSAKKVPFFKTGKKLKELVDNNN